MHTFRKSAPFLVAILCLALVGCTAAQIIADLNIAVQAAEIVVPLILPLITGNSANPSAVKVVAWLDDALKGLAAVSACQAAGETQAQLALCVTQNLAGVVSSVPDLAGLPATIAGLVRNLAADVAKILSTYGTQPGLSASHAKAEQKAGDADALKDLNGRISAMQVKLAGARK